MKYKLSDLIDMEQFRNLQDRLNAVYSFPAAIVDNGGNILMATAWQDICTQFHKINEDCERICLQSDQYLLAHLSEANPVVSYRCPHGLMNNATPIIIDGIHYGTFFTGQFFLEKPDLVFFQAQAKKYGLDEDAYLAAVKKVPIWTQEQLKGYLFFMEGLIALISASALKKLEETEARTQIEEREGLFRTLSDKTPLGMSLIDIDGRYEYVNPAFVKIFGYSLSDIPTGKEWFRTAYPDPEYRREAMAGWQEDLNSYPELEIRPRIYEVRCKDGSFRAILFRPVTLSSGKQLIIYEDITERRKADEALRVSEEAAKRLTDESELIAEIGRIISSTLDIEQVYERFADKVKELIPFDRIAINTINRKDYTRTIQYVQGDIFAGNRIGEVVSIAGTGLEQVIRTKSSLLINSTSTEELRRKLSAAFQFGAQSTMMIPLILKDEVLGSLAIHSAKMDAYSESDLRLAERMASQIAGSIANAQLFRERTQAEKILQDTLESLRKAINTTIQVMVSTVEARDPYTAGHQLKSANLARAIATEMKLPQGKIEGLRMASSIHDIGKISIPAEILSKPTMLSETEFTLIKEHARKGYEMLKDVESPWPLAVIVYQHHEKMDGSGYPRNLKGEEILMEARILTVADVVEAMASHRPYRPGLGIDAALNEIEKNRGIFYDIAVADACLRLFREKGFKLERD